MFFIHNQHNGIRTVLQMVVAIVLLCGISLLTTFAQSMTSSSYQVENPTFILEGGISSSSSFQYFSSTGEISIGESLSSSFIDHAGFLYYPIATTPIVTATPGVTQVVLTWTASTGTLANISSYDVGISTSSSGPYTYTTVGNVLTYTATGLAASTPYYFKIRSYASGILLSESAMVSATPTAPSGGGGGGGGGSGSSGSGAETGGVNFSGKAYPKSSITILKDGQIVLTTVAGTDANFSASVSGISHGNYVFSIYSEDSNGNRSSPLTFPVFITADVTLNVTGIFIAPTIAVDKSQVKRGDNIAIFGQTLPESDVTISVHSDPEFFKRTPSDKNGAYLYNFDTSILDDGDHVTKSKTAKGGEISAFGKTVGFIVGDETILADKIKQCPARADLNGDCRVNLVDFSIAAYWYKRPLNAAAIAFELAKLNHDGKIDLIDFSIMAFYWTG